MLIPNGTIDKRKTSPPKTRFLLRAYARSPENAVMRRMNLRQLGNEHKLLHVLAHTKYCATSRVSTAFAAAGQLYPDNYVNEAHPRGKLRPNLYNGMRS